jgi:hypothetical protein
MHRENDANHVLVSTTTALHNAFKRPCNLHSPLSLRINAIVDDHIAVALLFAKLLIFNLLHLTIKFDSSNYAELCQTSCVL